MPVNETGVLSVTCSEKCGFREFARWLNIGVDTPRGIQDCSSGGVGEVARWLNAGVDTPYEVAPLTLCADTL